MQLPESRFDGIFANASIFHVPSQELQRVLLELFQTLKSRGVLFSSADYPTADDTCQTRVCQPHLGASLRKGVCEANSRGGSESRLARGGGK